MPLVEAKSRISLTNILFPTDFSEQSAAALPYAAAIARRYGSKIFLAHVVSPHLEPAETSNGPPFSGWDVAEREMAILDRSDLLTGVKFETLLLEGELWEVLSEAVRNNDVDMIVLGTSGQGGFKRLFVGSVAEDLIREAPCPVMTIGPDVPRDHQWKEHLKEVLFATDFRPGSLAALMYAVFFAEESGAQLTLLHVCEAIEEGTQQRIAEARAARRMAEMIPAENSLALPPRFLVESGDAADAVLRLARTEHADLIVTGARETAHDWWHRHFAWTTLHRIVADAPCPVLTVKG